MHQFPVLRELLSARIGQILHFKSYKACTKQHDESIQNIRLDLSGKVYLRKVHITNGRGQT